MMPLLSLLLLGPWLVILGWAYWAFPKSLPRTRPRRAFDAAALLLAAIAAVSMAAWVYNSFTGPTVDSYGRHSGAIWQHVAPVLYAYGGFSAVLVTALLLRMVLWRRR